MGGKGPPPTPKRILELRGSWRAKTGADTLDVDPETPDPPHWMNELELSVWHRLVELLCNLRIIGIIDQYALSRYCVLSARFLEIREFLQENGDTFPVKSGSGITTMRKQWPQVKEMGNIADKLLRLEKEFGMTPSARARIVAPTESGTGGTPGESPYFQSA